MPADILVLKTNDRKRGRCYLETKFIDGETNLKIKTVPDNMRKMEIEDILSSNI